MLTCGHIVIRDAQGHYLSEFGMPGEGPGRFASVHGLTFGDNGDLYVVDRNNQVVQVFEHVNRDSADAVPRFRHQATWTGFGFPLDIRVSDEYAWITDIRPPKIVQMDLQGNHVYSWLLPADGPARWLEMHSFDVDRDGNLYGTDNQLGRTQKLVPKEDADPRLLVQ